MYKQMLKEETERVLFQYIDEYINVLNIKQVDIDDYLKTINLEDEANDIYYYYNTEIDNHFKKPIFIEEDDSRPNFDEFYKEFYKSIRTAFLEEVNQN